MGNTTTKNNSTKQLARLQAKYNEQYKNKRKPSRTSYICISPAKAREDVEYTRYYLEGCAKKNKTRAGAKISQYKNHM